MVLAAVEIPEVKAKSEAGDDHAGKAHGNENHGPHVMGWDFQKWPHVTIASVGSLLSPEVLATTEKFSEKNIEAALSSD